ncbi:MAG: flagellar hook-length control protein FliK [Nitrosomonas sp.]|nr:flagellar hook-length control protein FliK [Nitrosomonas sp.]
MLNLVTTAQTQIQTKQPLTNGNNSDIARSNKLEENQFNNILEREVAEKKSSQTSEDTANTANDSVSESKESTSAKIDTGNKTDNKDAHDTANTTNSANDITQSTPQTISQPIAIQTAQIITAENKSDIAEIQMFPLTAMATLSSNQLSSHEKTPSHGLAAHPTASLLSSQPTTQQSNMTNFLESNRLWQPLQTANSADSGKILPFSTEINKELLTRLSEPSALFHDDVDTIHQSGLNSLTQTLTQSTTQTTAPHSLNLDTQIGQPKWNGEFAQKIIWLATQQHQVAELRLNPAHLGPIEIMLSLTHENGTQASAQFVSPHLAVREAIESALPRLRELMAESGIQLGDVMVGTESFQQQEQGEQHARPFVRGTHGFNITNDSDSNLEMNITTSKHNGIVNTFA